MSRIFTREFAKVKWRGKSQWKEEEKFAHSICKIANRQTLYNNIVAHFHLSSCKCVRVGSKTPGRVLTKFLLKYFSRTFWWTTRWKKIRLPIWKNGRKVIGMSPAGGLKSCLNSSQPSSLFTFSIILRMPFRLVFTRHSDWSAIIFDMHFVFRKSSCPTCTSTRLVRWILISAPRFARIEISLWTTEVFWWTRSKAKSLPSTYTAPWSRPSLRYFLSYFWDPGQTNTAGSLWWLSRLSELPCPLPFSRWFITWANICPHNTSFLQKLLSVFLEAAVRSIWHSSGNSVQLIFF